MIPRSFNPRPLAALSLILVAGGSIAVACSSERDPDTGNPALNPDDPNPSSAGNGGSGTALPPVTGNGGSGVAQPPNEGQAGSLSVDPNPPNDPPPGSGGTTQEPPPEPPGLSANCEAAEGQVPELTLELVATLNQPIYVTGAPGDDERLYVLQKGGAVRIIQNGELQETPFIDIGNMLVSQGTNELGLLGMAFHPDYQNNGLFYLHFSSNGSQGLPGNNDTALAEFQVSADRAVADPATRRVVMGIDDPATNHNGGQISFGTDGMLYFGMGDGGSQDDPNGNGQNLNTLLGKILRIDPLGRTVNNAYGIPAGNLTDQNPAAADEIWAYGLRNPWRFSFDACTGDLYIGDVGQNTTEEIDFVQASGEARTIAAGTNFGWRIMEGPACRPGEANCNAQAQAGLTLPVDSYGRGVGTSVTGGYVYRGSNVPGLRGTYIYADYNSANFFRFRMQGGQIADKVDITNQMRPAGGGAIDQISSFGTDNAGEMYVTAFMPGAVYRVAAAP